MNLRNEYSPFIKKFRTKSNHYIYDVNSNEIIQVNKIIYSIFDEVWNNDINAVLKKFKSFNPSDIKKCYKQILSYKKKYNYFSDHRPLISFKSKSTDFVKKILNSSLNQLVLEATEKCNLRCKYCVFSGAYSNKRPHSMSNMTFKTAKKAIDYFLKRCSKNGITTPTIGFYGGEPLLNIRLIYEIIDYVNSLKNMFPINYTVTTNGTLLTEKIANYFSKKGVHLLVSLDGPKMLHDRYRVYKNGNGTYEKIIRNLLKIKDSNSEYFKNHISYNCVIAPPYDFDILNDFFYKNDLFSKNKNIINFSNINPYETTFFKDNNLMLYEKNKIYLINKLRQKYKSDISNKQHQDIYLLKKLFDRDFSQIHTREMKFIQNTYPPQGTCLPGERRVFVNVKGNFFMCEKVNASYPIGNVDDGFDFEKISNFLIEYENFFKDCRNCWALRFCLKCFTSICENDNFSYRRKNELCKQRLYIIERNLEDYCEIREKNNHAFDFFKEWKFA